MEAITYCAIWEESDGEYWHEGDCEVQANDIQEAIRLVVANCMMGENIIEVRHFSVKEKEV